jgi:hypothetical protein
MVPVHEHRFRPQPLGSLTLRQFVESLRRWTPEMRAIAQLAVTRSEDERRRYLAAYAAGGRGSGPLDSFVRWSHSDPRIDAVPAILADLERPEADYEGALEAEATTLVRLRGDTASPARRVSDYLGLLGIETGERLIEAFRQLLPPGTPDSAVVATVRLMRRRWLEIYGDDPFFAE